MGCREMGEKRNKIIISFLRLKELHGQNGTANPIFFLTSILSTPLSFFLPSILLPSVSTLTSD